MRSAETLVQLPVSSTFPSADASFIPQAVTLKKKSSAGYTSLQSQLPGKLNEKGSHI